MTFEVEVNGHLRAVAVEAVGAAGPAGGRFKVGSTFVDCRRTDLGFSLIFEDGRVVDVATTAQAPGEWLLSLIGGRAPHPICFANRPLPAGER